MKISRPLLVPLQYILMLWESLIAKLVCQLPHIKPRERSLQGRGVLKTNLVLLL
ncbi:hypothetical protein FOMG_19736 [Fusarium oxysporum f. sp. melonis 26406]|uniref:Uncharacterized protein n=2 Tax=Fusarium oxysporum species complex TaxID=171631 RepID=X0ILP8_FUSO5|nr:uncharacterized protein FOIG_16923 [Fusarium odoratissimum NRRL 54006]EXK23487.1 hypothetical protein FOMG_19736 [Fusarium oxysporum f. sp. melonis 26406]EXL89793.1 hypothetical protein FOIG_16923 [Fusarium odoratissimum NRRL 54006]